jgi:putative MATE family efflux protein
MLAGPMVVGIIATISVSLVDTYFVGKLGTSPLAALSFTFPVTMAVTSLAIGLGAGAASVVSRAVGSDNHDDATRLTTDSLVLASLLVIGISLLGFLTVDILFELLGAQGETRSMIVRYMQIWYLSLPFLVVPMVANSVIRAIGDAFWPSLIMLVSAAINVLATPILIFGFGPIPALDIEGAAWGTTVARVFTFAVAIWLVVYRERLVTWVLPAFSTLLSSWFRIAKVAIPAALGNAVNPIGIAIVTAIIATFGESTVAAFGVATRVESFAVIPMLALSAVIGPVVGQNWGAQKVDRVRLALKQSFAACFVWALVLALTFWLSAEFIVSIFTPNSEVSALAAKYLYIVPLSVWGYGWTIVAAGAYNAIGKSITGLGFYLSRTALFYVPLSFIASMLAGSHATFIAIAVANTLAGIVVGFLALHGLTKIKRQE